jgi:predicted nuclease with TOPRIM domain
MSLVSFADYLVSLKDGYEVSDSIRMQQDFKKQFEQFFCGEEIIMDKNTKTKEKSVDIKPMISLIAFERKEYEEKLSSLVADSGSMAEKLPESTADIYENGIKLYLQLDTGSSANLKPELVMEAFYNYLGLPFEAFAWQVHRLEVYTRDADGKLIALDKAER